MTGDRVAGLWLIGLSVSIAISALAPHLSPWSLTVIVYLVGSVVLGLFCLGVSLLLGLRD